MYYVLKSSLHEEARQAGADIVMATDVFPEASVCNVLLLNGFIQATTTVQLYVHYIKISNSPFNTACE